MWFHFHHPALLLVFLLTACLTGHITTTRAPVVLDPTVTANPSITLAKLALLENETCSLNGVLQIQKGQPTASTTCVCDKGWRGKTCNELALCAVDDVTQHGFWDANLSTWGASPIYQYINTSFGLLKTVSTPEPNNGTATLFAAAMGGECGLSSWASNSYIVELRAGRSFSAPFQLVSPNNPLTAPETHNPEALLHDGNFSIFVYDGCGNYSLKRCGSAEPDQDGSALVF